MKSPTHEDVREIQVLIQAGESTKTIVRVSGFGHSIIGRIRNDPGFYLRTKKRELQLSDRFRQPGDPTPEEIAAMCEELRAAKSDPPGHAWTAPEVSTAYIRRR